MNCTKRMKKYPLVFTTPLAIILILCLLILPFFTDVLSVYAINKEGMQSGHRNGDPQLIFPFKNIYPERSFAEEIKKWGIASKVPVLMYHHILKEKDKKGTNTLIVAEEDFAGQMSYLYENGYTTITALELEKFLEGTLKLPKKAVLLTFDDGYKSNYLYAYPLLKKYGFRATISLIPKKMPETPEKFNPARLNYLSWQEVTAGQDVFEYISHSFSHVSMKNLGYRSAYDEIKKVEELLDVKYFVYPVGHTSEASLKVLKELKYQLAFTTKPGIVTTESNPLRLPRQRVNGGMGIRSFKALLQ
jgi:peptidoglycan/xylan/chitin deacetylase (PgdA/CDA1 family)